MVSELEAAQVRQAFDQGGEASAGRALRRLFLGLPDNAETRAHARAIAGWRPEPLKTVPAGLKKTVPAERLPPIRRRKA